MVSRAAFRNTAGMSRKDHPCHLLINGKDVSEVLCSVLVNLKEIEQLEKVQQRAGG